MWIFQTILMAVFIAMLNRLPGGKCLLYIVLYSLPLAGNWFKTSMHYSISVGSRKLNKVLSQVYNHALCCQQTAFQNLSLVDDIFPHTEKQMYL